MILFIVIDLWRMSSRAARMLESGDGGCGLRSVRGGPPCLDPLQQAPEEPQRC